MTTPAAAANKRDDDVLDVAIVGAGISGLVAARALVRGAHPKTLKIAVFDAMDRAGGRIFTDSEGTELGAAFFGPGQLRMMALVEELGLTTYGRDRWAHGARRQPQATHFLSARTGIQLAREFGCQQRLVANRSRCQDRPRGGSTAVPKR